MMHCRRDDFDSFGGFDETIYAAEDVQLAYDLKKAGTPRGHGRPASRTASLIICTKPTVSAP